MSLYLWRSLRCKKEVNSLYLYLCSSHCYFAKKDSLYLSNLHGCITKDSLHLCNLLGCIKKDSLYLSNLHGCITKDSLYLCNLHGCITKDSLYHCNVHGCITKNSLYLCSSHWCIKKALSIWIFAKLEVDIKKCKLTSWNNKHICIVDIWKQCI